MKEKLYESRDDNINLVMTDVKTRIYNNRFFNLRPKELENITPFYIKIMVV